MPLSEHEQRILNEIEQGYYRRDPRSARRIAATTLRRYLGRNLRWASLTFVAGLVILVASFATSWVVGLVGFLVMTVAAVSIVQNIRRIGRHELNQLTADLASRGFAERINERAERMRRRFREDRTD